MQKIKQFFGQFRWWETSLLFAYFVAEIVLGVMFKSSILLIFNVLTSAFATFLLAKGNILGSMLMVVNLSLYFVNCLFNKFYGEIIFCVCISIPLCLLTVVSWMKNRRGQEVKINKKIGWKEWLILVLVLAASTSGVYFLLRHFNTANLIVSTICSVLNVLASYLQMRRSEFSFFVFAVTSVVTLILWATTVLQGALQNIPFIVNYVVLITVDCFGVFNWIGLKQVQSKQDDHMQQILKICKTDLH